VGGLFHSLDGTSWFPDLSDDVHFRTYVNIIPEPATFTLAWLGATMLAIFRRRDYSSSTHTRAQSSPVAPFSSIPHGSGQAEIPLAQ
jgi:uncharacterized protein (TIGR03382 family)